MFICIKCLDHARFQTCKLTKKIQEKKQLTVHPVNPCSLCLAPLSLLTNADPKPSLSAACANDRCCKRGVLPPNSATKPGDTGPPTTVESWNDDRQKVIKFHPNSTNGASFPATFRLLNQDFLTPS